VPPTDIVTANRPRVDEGDLPMPLPEIWRRRFPEPTDRRLWDNQHRLEQVLGLQPEHLEAVRLTLSAGTWKGLPAAGLAPAQQDLLRELLGAYVGRVPDALADAEAEKYAGERLGELCFAWAGGLEPGQPHYYRIQGPRLLVEYDNTQNDVNHVHAVWRDPASDFADDVLTHHRRQAHGG
jgi:uncharacterized protein DUF3500